MLTSGLAVLLPGLTAALAFGVSNVLGKLAFVDGADVLALVAFRSVVGIALLWAWLRLGAPARPHTRRARWIALGLGVLFAANVTGVFGAIRAIPVPVAVLAYFIYPLLTGLAGAATGIDRVGWRGFLAALAAFVGLAMMLGARIGDVDLLGVGSALAAAVVRVVSLLITRASLHNTDARLNTWYSLVPSAAVFVALSLLTTTWNAPQSAFGWAAFIGMSVTSTVSTLTMFVSITRIGAFGTALIMNLEPLVSTLASVALLGEVLRPVQAFGGALMLLALCAFQMRR